MTCSDGRVELEPVARNRQVWDQVNESFADGDGSARWSNSELTRGLFERPESELGLLGDVAGLDVVELGCGTASLSSWLARHGANPIGVDLSGAQLRTARRCQLHSGPTFPLLEADGEHVPLHGEWIGLLHAAGLVLDALLELSPPPFAADPQWYEIVTAEWAGRWPAEDVWLAHRGS